MVMRDIVVYYPHDMVMWDIVIYHLRDMVISVMMIMIGDVRMSNKWNE